MQNNSTPTGNGSMVEPVTQQQFSPSAPGATPYNTGATLTSDGQPGIAPPVKKQNNTLIETIVLVVVSLIAVIFIWLFIQKYIEWDAISTDIDGRVKAAVTLAVSENTQKMEEQFAEREKYPYEEFAGPADYGSLTFEYPKTWSVYVERDAASGGEFRAYLNPQEVLPLSGNNINALRVIIRNESFDSVVKTYDGALKKGDLVLKTETIGGVLSNIYTGKLSKDRQGAVMAMKIRDKTILLQTDAETFLEDFYRILETVKVIE